MNYYKALLILIVLGELVVIGALLTPSTPTTATADFEDLDYDRFQNGTTLIPNATVQFHGSVVKLPMSIITVNRHGFRDRPYRIEKPPNTTRIAVLGDSYTFGWGVNQSQTYSTVLERRLNHSTDDAVQTLNFGVPGLTTTEEVEQFRERWVQFGPDVVIVGYAFNDIMNMSERDRIQTRLHREGVWANRSEPRQSQKIAERTVRLYWEQFQQKDFEQVVGSVSQPFQTLEQLSEQYGFDVIIYVFSDTADMGGALKKQEQQEFLQNTTSRYGWALLRSRPIRDSVTDSHRLILHVEDTHPSPFYHREIGEQLATHIQKHPCYLQEAQCPTDKW